MNQTTVNTEPTTLRAGMTWQWRLELADWPADVWTLTYHFRNATDHFDVEAIADGTDHDVIVAANVSTDYAPGHYDWYLIADNGSDRHELDRGRVEVMADITTPQAHDGRVYARKVLDAVEAVLLGRATKSDIDIVTAQSRDQSITYDRGRLLELRSQLRNEVAREEGTGGALSNIRVHFR